MRRKEGQWYSGNIRKKQIEKDRVWIENIGVEKKGLQISTLKQVWFCFDQKNSWSMLANPKTLICLSKYSKQEAIFLFLVNNKMYWRYFWILLRLFKGNWYWSLLHYYWPYHFLKMGWTASSNFPSLPMFSVTTIS